MARITVGDGNPYLPGRDSVRLEFLEVVTDRRA